MFKRKPKVWEPPYVHHFETREVEDCGSHEWKIASSSTRREGAVKVETESYVCSRCRKGKSVVTRTTFTCIEDES